MRRGVTVTPTRLYARRAVMACSTTLPVLIAAWPRATTGSAPAAFAGHTNVELLDRARAAGADPVVARGQAAISTGKVVEQAIAARSA